MQKVGELKKKKWGEKISFWGGGGASRQSSYVITKDSRLILDLFIAVIP